MQDLLILLLKLLSNQWSFFSSRNLLKNYSKEIIYILIKQIKNKDVHLTIILNKEKTKTTKPFKSRGKIKTNTVQIILTQKQCKIIVLAD